MRIAIVTDAWSPQVNGVVRTLQSVIARLGSRGHEAIVISPDQFNSLPCPTYGEIRLGLASASMVGRRIAAERPGAVHIATEGPLGLAARRWCLRNGLPFSSAYHTQFPDYVAHRTGLPPGLLWRYIRWFHGPSSAVLASTGTVKAQLEARGIKRVQLWSRGVDLDLFRPDVEPHPVLANLPRPVLLYVGRIAVEKNVQAFLDSRHIGSKVLVGDGPDLTRLQRLYPDACFLGALHGKALAAAYAGADVFVFPSRTDTFGLVMIEALACGTPVAAYPVPGPLDVLDPSVGCMDVNLDQAIAAALLRDRGFCSAYAHRFSWDKCVHQFLSALIPIEWAPDGCEIAEALA
jgi:glycosyltransferase involved in cell wall biosynthesis